MKKYLKHISLLLAVVCIAASFSACRYDLLLGDLTAAGPVKDETPTTLQPENTTLGNIVTAPQTTEGLPVETTDGLIESTTGLPVETTTLAPVIETTMPAPVETTAPAPVETTTQAVAKTPDTMSNQELLAFFNSSLNAIKSNKIGFTRSKSTTLEDIVLSNSLANSLIGVVKGMLFSEDTEYATVAKGQSSNDVLSPSGQSYASALTLNDIKSISATKNGSSYVITVYGVDCDDPSSASPCAKLFDYLTVDDVMNIYVPKVGATVDKANVAVSFKNSYAVLTVTADGTVQNYETHTYNYLTMKDASIKKGVTINTDLDVTIYTITKFYDWAY